MARKELKPYYANVCDRDGHRVYTSFGTDLAKMIDDAETWLHGVVAIEEAHAGKPPVWTRPAESEADPVTYDSALFNRG